MSDQEDFTPLTRTDAARRRFLTQTALVAAGSSALGLLAGLRTTEAAAAEASPGECALVDAPMKDVEGKVAFITGGDSGIGLGMARAFTDAGMKVVITYRTKAHLDSAMKTLESAGNRVHPVSVDVTDRAGMEQAAVEAERVFGKVHVLVNNAGVAVATPISRATYDDWDWAMNVDVNGVFNGVRTFLPRMKAHGENGQIVSTSSLAGLLAGAGVYSASKFAVVGLMESLRFELAGTNIGTSVFCPGLVNTNIFDSNRNRPSNLADTTKPDPATAARMQQAMKNMKGPPAGMDPLEAGQRVLRGIRNNDLYILTTPYLASDFHARDEALVASLPTDLTAPPARVAMERMLMGKSIYIAERDRKRCELANARKT